jgi:hypothetical protein
MHYSDSYSVRSHVYVQFPLLAASQIEQANYLHLTR